MDLEKRKKTNKIILKVFGIIFIVVFGVPFIISLFIPGAHSNSTVPKVVKDTIVEKPVTPVDEKEEIKGVLQTHLNSFDKGIDFTTFKGSMEGLYSELILFKSWGNAIKRAAPYDELKPIADKLRAKVAKTQAKEFPLLRQAYGSISNKKLWENDIEVSTAGMGNSVINITGGMFAANKNKQDMQNMIQKPLTDFRFKQSRYRWFKGESEYTYYDMKPEKDSDFVNVAME